MGIAGIMTPITTRYFRSMFVGIHRTFAVGSMVPDKMFTPLTLTLRGNGPGCRDAPASISNMLSSVAIMLLGNWPAFTKMLGLSFPVICNEENRRQGGRLT